MADDLRLGIAGLGRSYERTYLPALKKLGLHDQIVAVAEPDPRRRAQMTPKRAHEFARFDDLVERGRLDAVIDLTPSSDHAAHALIAMQAAVPVLSELPVVVNSADLRRLRGERAARFVTPAFARRFWDEYRALRAEPPDTPWLAITRITNPDKWDAVIPSGLRPEQDVLPEMLDLMTWLAGEQPATVEARSLRHSAQAVLRFASTPRVSTVMAVYGSDHEEIFEVPGAAHRLDGGPKRQWRGRSRSAEGQHAITAAERLIEAWLQAATGGERHPDLPTFDDVLATVAMQEAFDVSLKAGGSPAPLDGGRAAGAAA